MERTMIRLYLSITHIQMQELKEHLYYNGYRVDWESDDVITVDEDEVEYVKTILRDRGIGYVDEQFWVSIDKGIDMFSNMSKCLAKKWNYESDKRCDERCDECEYMYGCGNLGQIKNLFENVQKWLLELKEYQELEKQGHLLKVPYEIKRIKLGGKKDE